MARSVLLLGVLTLALTAPALAAAGSPPPGATALCRDGTNSYSRHHSGTCSWHGGVAVWLDSGTPSTAGEPSGTSSASSPSACEIERWPVKTLQDRPRLLPPQVTSIHFLVTRPAPHPLPWTRQPFERHVYTVTAAVTLVRPEADSDLHLVPARAATT